LTPKTFSEESDTLLQLLDVLQVTQQGHFVLTSGRHSDTYVQKFRLLEQPHLVKRMVELMIYNLGESILGCNCVLGPTTGGVIVAYEAAGQLDVSSVYAEKDNEQFVLKRGAKINPGDRVVIVDDVYTTGKSVDCLKELVISYGAVPIATGVLINRSESDTDVISALNVSAKSYAADNIPEWLNKIPINTK